MLEPARPADTDEGLAGIGERELVHSPGLVLGRAAHGRREVVAGQDRRQRARSRHVGTSSYIVSNSSRYVATPDIDPSLDASRGSSMNAPSGTSHWQQTP